jgi:hypothetical protein
MLRDQKRPITDEQLKAAAEDIEKFREETRDRPAKDLGDEPEDYRADVDNE